MQTKIQYSDYHKIICCRILTDSTGIIYDLGMIRIHSDEHTFCDVDPDLLLEMILESPEIQWVIYRYMQQHHETQDYLMSVATTTKSTSPSPL